MVHRSLLRSIARLGLLLAVASLLGGCSLLFASSRPTPGAERNLFCTLEYRPDPARSGEPDLLFLAGAMPYRAEEFLLSLPDVVFHMIFAPGRHLSAPIHLRGVICEPPLWAKGHRLPMRLSLRRGLLCRREGLERVEIGVETKWGSCRRTIPAGDATPRCREWYGRTSAKLRSLSDTACPAMPQPTRESRRGRTPSGVFWVVITEGAGPCVEPGQRIAFHETVLTRGWMVARSTHFDGELRRARLEAGELPPWLVEAMVGMRVGEHRRLTVPSALVAAFRDPERERPVAEQPFRWDVELVAVEEPPRRGRHLGAATEERPPTVFPRQAPAALPVGEARASGSRSGLGESAEEVPKRCHGSSGRIRPNAETWRARWCGAWGPHVEE